MSLVYDPESGRYIDVPLGGFGVTPYTAPAPQATSPRVQAAPNFRRPGMLGGLFANLGNRIGPGKSLIHGNFDLGNLKELPGNIRATQIWENGPTVAQGANALSGIYQGGKAVKGLYERYLSNNWTDKNNVFSLNLKTFWWISTSQSTATVRISGVNLELEFSK